MISNLTPAEQEQLNSALQAVVRRNVALDDVLDDTIKGKERQRLTVAIGSPVETAVKLNTMQRISQEQDDRRVTADARATAQSVPERAVEPDCECGVPARRCQIAGH